MFTGILYLTKIIKNNQGQFHSFIYVFLIFISPVFTSYNAYAKSARTVNPLSIEKSRLTGKVIDASTGKPLQGAVVFIHELKIGTTTDVDGNFTTSEVPNGKYLVEVSFIGFASFLETININGFTPISFQLKYAVVENEGVTVTGVASATKIKQSPQPITIVKKNILFSNASSGIIESLSHLVPGIASLNTGVAIAKPVIRGLSYNRVITIHDGIRQEGQQWGDEHGIEVDEYSIQKVEVLKGPASLLYGSDGMGGALHLITNTPVAAGEISGNLLAQYNANNQLWGNHLNIAGHLKNGFNWNIYGTNKVAKDYHNKYDAKVLNSRFNEHNFGGYIGFNKSWGYSHLLISNFNQRIGVVDGMRDSATGKFLIYSETQLARIATETELNSSAINTPYQHVQHFKIALDNNIALGSGRLAVNVGYQKNSRKEFANALMPNTPDLHFNLGTINYHVLYQLKENKGWKKSFGVNGMLQQNRNLAEEQLIPAYHLFDIGGFAYVKKSFSNKVTISGGLRYDYRNLQTEGLLESGNVPKFIALQKQYSNWSGSIGLSYNASEWLTFKTNIARGFRAPTVSELSSNGTHEGTNRYELGDQHLTTESSLQFDAGVEINTEHIGFMFNAFYNTINNYIYYSKLASVLGGDSLIDANGTFNTAFKFKQFDATLYGFEAKLDVHPHPFDWLHFSNSFAMVNAQFTNPVEGATYLPFIPPARLLTEIRGNFKHIGKLLNDVYVKFEIDNMFSQQKIFTAYDTETATAGYTLLNIGGGMDFKIKHNKLLSLYISLNNLLDVAYQNHLSRLKYTDVNIPTGRMGVFNMGRNFTVKCNIPLNFKAH